MLTTNTKYDICWYIVWPISKHIPTPSLVSLSDLSIIFIGWVFFSLESHLKGEPCDYFILSLIVAQNYVLACMFCIVWCQQIRIWNKQVERSIYLIKQVWFFYKSDDQRRSRKHRKLRFEIEEQWNTEIRFIGSSGRVPTGKVQYFLVCQILCAQTMAIICIWFWYDKNPFFLHVTSSYNTV